LIAGYGWSCAQLPEVSPSQPPVSTSTRLSASTLFFLKLKVSADADGHIRARIGEEPALVIMTLPSAMIYDVLKDRDPSILQIPDAAAIGIAGPQLAEFLCLSREQTSSDDARAVIRSWLDQKVLVLRSLDDTSTESSLSIPLPESKREMLARAVGRLH